MTAIRRVLVPLDGSELAETALPWAEVFVARTGATIVALRAATAHGLVTTDLEEAELRAVREADDYVTRLADRLRAKDIEVETAVPYGNPGEAIVEATVRRDADVVVMATHGRSGLGRWVYGSVAERVLHGAAVPVLLVRAGAPAPDPVKGPHTIVVTLDGSDLAEQALTWAADLGRLLHARVRLIRVVDIPASEDVVAHHVVNDLTAAEREASSYLHAVSDGLRGDGLDIAYTVRYGSPFHAIPDYAREINASMIVMATHGRSAMGQLIHGSVAGGVLRNASAPVLLVPARDADAGRTPALPRGAVAPEEPGIMTLQVTLSLSGRDVLMLREAVTSTMWLGVASDSERTSWQELLGALPDADTLRQHREAKQV